MKKHYDFSKAEQGKMYRPAAQLRIPIYLDPDVQRALAGSKRRSRGGLSKMVSSILRKELEVAEMLATNENQ
jgi:hypothetical protein